MARYVDEYQGIVGHAVRPHGMDPNYRGGYRGMRTRGGPGQAEYGSYRMSHAQDFGGEHGPFGMYPGRGPYTGEMEAGYDRPGHHGYEHGWHGGRGGYDRDVRGGQVGYDREWQGGAVRDIRPHQGMGYAQQRGHGRYDQDVFGHERGFRGRYANRGLSSGGYSEGWAWGPMRGAR